ncbi:MAG TPA: hypothetical protein DEO84_09860 [candidate division Zixibacteria bacterium]|nr:hypothetical protein [candidate division Zixibacteria bacterium]
MKKALLIMLFLALLIPAVVQAYPLVPIDSIQWVPVGQDSSRIAGDTVITGGLITCGTGAFYAGTGVTFYMENPSGGDFSGIMAYSAQAQGYPTLVPGDSILCTAVVSEYNSLPPPEFVTMTELLIIPSTFEFRLYGMPEPEAMDVPCSEIDSTAHADSAAEKYEGVFIKVHGLTVDSLINYSTTSTWICSDSTGHQICVREAADSIPNSFRPPVGTQFDFVQGVVYHRFGAYLLQPRYMRDMRLSRGAPIVTVAHTPLYPLVGDMVTINAYAVDDEPIPQDSVRLFYRINLLPWTPVSMTRIPNTDNYTFTLPSIQAGWVIDYFVHAVDDSSNITNEPYEAPLGFHRYTVQAPRTMTIAEARVDANQDYVPDLLDSAVIVTGIAVSPNFNTRKTDFYLQQGNAGIEVFYDSTQIMVNPGDSVTVNGIIAQYYGKTQVVAYRNNRITLHGSGHLPETTVVTCNDLADINGEAHEGTLIKVNNVLILPTPNPWPALGTSATMTMVDGDTATLRIDLSTDIDGQPQVTNRADIVGVLSQYDYSTPLNGFYEFMPRFYTDFTWRTAVDDDVDIPNDYSLSQNYPNPFNPSTLISFNLKEKTHVSLSIYNIMGERVNNLVNQELEPGAHSVRWDGVNSAGQKVSSGIYFYKLDTNEFSATKRMVLLK